MFDDDFIQSLPKDRLAAAHAMCQQFIEIDRDIPKEAKLQCYPRYIEALGAFEAFCETFGFPFVPPKMIADKQENIASIRSCFYTLDRQLDQQITNVALLNVREKYRIKFGVAFLYEFSDGDLARIQTLVNELRDLLAESELFNAEHKERLLNKLESLQSEIHKRVPALDKFWGLIGEAGVALGKFGKDAKPFVDRIKEIAQVVWRTQARAEELPSGATLPLLTTEKDSE